MMEGKRVRAPQVKNKTPAPVQITAEQIIREAQERQQAEPKPPKQKITDPEELADYRLRKRKEFEDKIRRQKQLISNWIKYGLWEEGQHEFERARSVFERAIDVDYRNVTVWLKYAEMEMRNKNVNHARNVWDRAVTVLPRVNQFWYKYVHMEDILGNYANARQVFERWMEWEPDAQAWSAYIKFELRNREVQRARSIYDKFVACHPEPEIWIRRAKFEEKLNEVGNTRQVYESAVEYLGELCNDQIFIAFAKFEERCKEFERARGIYKYALDNIPKANATELYKTFISFEKQFGDRNEIEEVILGKRRFQYEEEINVNPKNYDIWFDYVRLEERTGNVERTRDVYERAIANVPPTTEKRFWRRYIYLWINYAIWEELENQDFEKVREIWNACVKLIPHQIFSFSKIWILFANFEIRQKNLAVARKIYGNAIGMCPKVKIFDEYISLELQLGNIDRCRTLYEKYLEIFPTNVSAWCKFAELEKYLDEEDRCRGIFELAIDQQLLDQPEVLWKTYIDFELANTEIERTRSLYKRLLERTKHVKVWISYAQFEKTEGVVEDARKVFEVANEFFKSNDDLKEERVLLLESWNEFEQEVGSEEDKKKVFGMLPKKVKKKRMIHTDDGGNAGWEEYYDYIFPDEKTAVPNLKILERARLWKKRKLNEGSNEIKTENS